MFAGSLEGDADALLTFRVHRPGMSSQHSKDPAVPCRSEPIVLERYGPLTIGTVNREPVSGKEAVDDAICGDGVGASGDGMRQWLCSWRSALCLIRLKHLRGP
jgi:hypothetical protein